MRTTLLAALLFAVPAFAQNKTINVVDDVGVGDHFPSQVPGAGSYRLPERELPVREAPPPREAAPAAREATPVEKTASDPGEWATPPAAPAAQAPAATPPPASPVVAAVTPAAPVMAAVPPTAPIVAAVAPSAPTAAPAKLSSELEITLIERASTSLLQGTCAAELPQLAELLDRSDRADTKARARILRARCFTQNHKVNLARAEYLAYLREFPNGRWVDEARDGLGEQ
ncbi:MAG: hypothetical protein IPJ65_32005 [Archangiaceae bacterium]|nr:hypothetical protein [Archangiaceae bacterium]